MSVCNMHSMTKTAKKANGEGFKHIILSPICVLLVFFPLGVASYYLHWGETLTFWFNFLAMIPLAKILGDATEELAGNLKNDMLSGLLNATFGNAVEMIMTIAFLRKHEYVIVKTTLLGSILSNMLLVLGMSFFFGGLVKRNNMSQPLLEVEEKKQPNRVWDPRGVEQSYSTMGSLVNTSMLLVSALVFGLVTIFNAVDDIQEEDMPGNGTATNEGREMTNYMLPISRKCSIVIIASYVAYIIFQLFTHADAMAEGSEDDDEGEEPDLTLFASLALLFGATVVVAISSEFLTDALEPALASAGMGKSFVGVILLPIVGNACEHVAAIRFAMQDKAGLAVGIAVGSSVQIALFVTPFSVLVGWLLGGTEDGINMDLDLGPLNVAVLILSVLIILSIVVDGHSNWLEGYMLMTAYLIVAILYWYIPDPKN